MWKTVKVPCGDTHILPTDDEMHQRNRDCRCGPSLRTAQGKSVMASSPEKVVVVHNSFRGEK